MLKNLKNKRGFTLIELMIVIAIIAILAAILVPNFLRARAQSQLSGCQSAQRNIATALEMFSVDNEGFYPADATAAAEGLTDSEDGAAPYMTQIGVCPSGPANFFGYVTNANRNGFGVNCNVDNAHQQAGIESQYPRYYNDVGSVRADADNNSAIEGAFANLVDPV